MSDLNWLWGSIIGLSSTIIGVVFGWFLTKPKNKNIAISIHYISKDPFIQRYDEFDARHGKHKEGELRFIKFAIHLILFNPSDRSKLVRNLRVEMYSTKNELMFCSNVADIEKVEHLASFVFPQDVAVMNIPPSTGILLKGTFVVANNALKSKESFHKNFIVYNDEKNKIKKTSFETFDYKSVLFIKES